MNEILKSCISKSWSKILYAYLRFHNFHFNGKRNDLSSFWLILFIWIDFQNLLKLIGTHWALQTNLSISMWGVFFAMIYAAKSSIFKKFSKSSKINTESSFWNLWIAKLNPRKKYPHKFTHCEKKITLLRKGSTLSAGAPIFADDETGFPALKSIIIDVQTLLNYSGISFRFN